MAELKKENMCVGEQSVAGFSQAYCETDIIVPDTKPDIVKILKSDAHGVVMNKSCSNNRISVEGRADINIMYLGEDGVVYAISASQPFSHIVDAKGVTDSMIPEVEVNAERTDCTVLNSRKMSVRVLLGVDANAISNVEAELCTEISDNNNLEILQKTVFPFTTVFRTADKFDIKEKAVIPAGNPHISSILSINATVTNREVTCAINKIIVKGTLCVSTVYIGEMSNNSICHMNHDIPFVEVMEAEGADENMDIDLKLDVENIYYDIVNDDDGDMRILEIECIVGAYAKGYQEDRIDVIEDAYSLNCPVNVKQENTVINFLAGRSSSEVSLKETVTISPDFPEIMQVYNVSARPVISSTTTAKDKIIIEGMMDCKILYLSNNPDSPINCYNHEFRFSTEVATDGAEEGMFCDVLIDIAHLTFNINMGREIELRFGVNFEVKAIAEKKITFLTDVELNTEDTICKKECCIRVYFPHEGETLWEVAKKYGTTCDRVAKINGIDKSAVLHSGCKLIVE